MDKRALGRWGEEQAVRFLRRRGYKILDMNFSCRMGEIDIIAEKDSDIHIFEVRTRRNLGSFPDSAESVMQKKRNRVMRTAERFVNENDLFDRNILFEVIRVTHDAQGNILSIDFVPF
jgi:putative endonuclease